MDIRRSGLCIVGLATLTTAVLQAETYTGSIGPGDGLTGTEVWDTAVLSWTVDDETNPGRWTYTYTFEVEAKAISHVIVGVSDIFLPSGIGEGSEVSCELDTYGPELTGNSTPGIPADIRGVKCSPTSRTLSYSWTIVSIWDPGWTDFYAKSGKHRGEWVYAYNELFGLDPPSPASSNGNNGGKILAPYFPSHERRVREFALGAFDRFREVIAPEDLTPRELRFVEKHIQVDSAHWTYILDAAGRQIFRPRISSAHLLPALQQQLGSVEEWLASQVPETIIERARVLAFQTLGADYGVETEAEVIPARELITSKGPDFPSARFHEGRTLVLFKPLHPEEELVRTYRSSVVSTPDGPRVTVQPTELPLLSNETAVSFIPGVEIPGTGLIERQPVRVDSTHVAPELAEAVDLFWEGLKLGLFAQVHLASDSLNFGIFFSSNENRFEIGAYSYEGEKFLQPDYQPVANPFYYDYCWDSLVAPTVDWVRNSDLYKKRVWGKWRKYGYKNGIRGNWLPGSQEWENESIEVTLHKNLLTYDFLVEDRKFIHLIDTCDDEDDEPDIPYWLDNPPGNRLEDAFYEDLENLHIGLIYTHGGPLTSIATGRSTFSFLRHRDRWAALREPADPGLGHGNLRHLFLETCSSMNWNNTTHTKNLFSDWMTGGAADGIRTIGGFDGLLVDGQSTGWGFFSRYNAGESISDSWFFTGIEQCTCNVPVVAAYGSTEEEAATTLFDGRFSQSRAGTGWVIAAEVIPQRVTHEDRACCFASTCVDLIFGACTALGGEPLDCGTTCERDAEKYCP